MKNILFLTHTNNNFCAVKLDGVYAAARTRGWNVNVVEFGCSAWGIGESVSTLRPDGVIFEGGRLNGTVDLGSLRNIPAVYLDTDFDAPRGKVSVRSDAEAIAKLAADEILSSAPVETVFFTQAPHKGWSRRREKSFRRRMRAAGVPFHVLRNVRSLADLRRPFAVFTATDSAAAMIFRSASTLGLACPQDFTLVSVDNETLFCENANPKVSSVEQDFYRAGTAAIEALERLFEDGPAAGGSVLIPPRRLVRRASSVRPRSDLSLPQTIAALVDARALEDITVADLAVATGCSRRTAENRFHAAYGYSIGEAILRRRFAEVERLLRLDSQLLDPIANMCGWKSSAHLKRSFKNRYGMTMSEWRRRA